MEDIKEHKWAAEGVGGMNKKYSFLIILLIFLLTFVVNALAYKPPISRIKGRAKK